MYTKLHLGLVPKITQTNFVNIHDYSKFIYQAVQKIRHTVLGGGTHPKAGAAYVP